MARPDFLILQDRSAEAGSLLGHKVFTEAVASMKATYMAQLQAAPIGDAEKLVAIHTKLKLLDEVVGELKSMVNAVRLAAQSKVENP